MKIIPALQLNGWLATEHKSIENQIIVKYEFRSRREFHCRLCDRVMQHRGRRQLSIKDTPYNELDIELEIETPILYCPHGNHYATIRPQAVHPSRGMTWRFMRRICELMVECSSARLSKLLRVSESSILRADSEMLKLLDKAYPVCMQGRRALIIDEKYLGRKNCLFIGAPEEEQRCKVGGLAALPGYRGDFEDLLPATLPKAEVMSRHVKSEATSCR